jgi:hypothetical protein
MAVAPNYHVGGERRGELFLLATLSDYNAGRAEASTEIVKPAKEVIPSKRCYSAALSTRGVVSKTIPADGRRSPGALFQLCPLAYR